MQRHVHRTRTVHQPPHFFHIQSAVRRQRADHNAVRAKVAERLNFLAHLLHFRLAVEKISEARADQDVDFNGDIPRDLPEQRRGRRRSADHQMGAQLQPVCAAKISRLTGGIGIHTGFDQGRIHAFSSFVSKSTCASW